MKNSSIQSNILRIDLTDEKITIEHPEGQFYRKYLGGMGFISYYLLKELEKGTDPLSPDNKLIFAAGPLTGVPIAGSGRHAVGAKSPLTGGFGCAESGGFWGAELKKAGFDAIIVEGKAKKPVYLWIKDGNAEIRDASHLWGKFTGESDSIIREELDEKLVRIAQIGPGGENLVQYACIMNELRDAAGRSGMGAVMGSKNLKAVAVRGSNKLDIASKDKLSEMRKLFNEKFLKPYSEVFSHGTPVSGTMKDFTEVGNLPIRNFRDGNGDFKAEDLDPRNVKTEVNLEMEGCYACSLRCKKIVYLDEKWDYDIRYGGPEYETLGALGSNCGISDFQAVSKAHELCNKYSIDTISTGVTISFAMECFENGILTKEDTNGLDLKFGNVDAMLKMTEMIGKREGLGDLLAEGSKKAAEKIGKGAEKYAMHVKGQEIPMHEPRLKRALGVGYMVSPTGAEHMSNLHDTALTNKASISQFKHLGILEPIPLENLSSQKIRALLYQVNLSLMINSLCMCQFMPWDVHQLNMILRASTGLNTTSWELMKIGERVNTMTRIFNLREGLTMDDDNLPDRFFSPTNSGAISETSLKVDEVRKARKTYYKMMGWNEKGIPKEEKIQELAIHWASEYL